MEPLLDDMANDDQLLKDDFFAIFEMMYERKQNLFPDDNRFIVEYSIENNDGAFYLQVASTPLET